jgi:hypothetical protein
VGWEWQRLDSAAQLFFVRRHHGFWVRKPEKRQKKERLALGHQNGGALNFV